MEIGRNATSGDTSMLAPEYSYKDVPFGHLAQAKNGAASAVQKAVRRFAADRKGNVVIMTALFLPVIVGLGGAAVNYSMGASNKAKLQSAVDAAVLAGAGNGGSASAQVT